MGCDDDGASPVLGFLVASFVFAGAFATLLVAMENPLQGIDGFGSDMRSRASSALDIIVRDPGETTEGSAAWNLDSDRLLRFGLADPAEANFLDGEKIRNLRRGEIGSALNGYLDYEEARTGLGLDRYDFHLRSFPNIASIEDSDWSKLTGIRVAYLGHFETVDAGSPVIQDPVISAVHKSDGYTEISVTIDYVSGPALDLFHLTLESDVGDGKIIQDLYTRLLEPGGSDTVKARIYDMDFDVGGGNRDLRLVVTDAVFRDTQRDVTKKVLPIVDGTTQYLLTIKPKQDVYDDGKTPTVILDKLDEEGDRYDASSLSVTLDVFREDGSAVFPTKTVTIPKKTSESLKLDELDSEPEGLYKLVVKKGSQEHVNWLTKRDAKLDSTTMEPTSENLKERGYLADLVEGFENSEYDATTNPEGDVFHDEMKELDALVDLLNSRYHFLVVGSRIKSSELQSDFPSEVEAWVEAGNTLIALGSHDKNNQWMKSITGAGVATANGGIGTPDPSHPVLHSPESLSYTSYDDQGYVYKLDGGKAKSFTHVLVKDEDGGKGGNKDTLAVSNAGGYGDGMIFITSYIPPEMLGGAPDTEKEAKKLLHNLIVQGFGPLFLDYGPTIPDKVQVASATRLAVMPHPRTPSELIEIKLVMYVFG